MGGKGIGELKPPLKMKQLQTNLINCVEPVKGQGVITAGNASARLKHWQRESEGRGRDEPFRQAWLHAGEPSHPWVRRVCLSGRSSCLPGPASVRQAARCVLMPTGSNCHRTKSDITPVIMHVLSALLHQALSSEQVEE